MSGGPTEHEPGRAAIDRALDALYPNSRDYRMGLLPDASGAPPPLAEVVAYRCASPRPHWHYVTYGLSEIEEKQSEQPELSGFGIELTLRLEDPSEAPPTWPINLLRWLAERVWNDGSPYGDLHSMPLPDGMLDAVSAGVDGLAFAVDAALGTARTSNGSVTFLQVVGLTAGEYQLMGRWDGRRVLDALGREPPGLLWRVGRRGLLEGPRRSEILRQAEADGSSQALDFVDGLAWDEGGIVLDALNRHVVLKFLRYRVAHGRSAAMLQRDQSLRLEPGPFAFHPSGAEARLVVPAEQARALAADLEGAQEGEVVRFAGKPVFVVGELFPLGRAFGDDRG